MPPRSQNVLKFRNFFGEFSDFRIQKTREIGLQAILRLLHSEALSGIAGLFLGFLDLFGDEHLLQRKQTLVVGIELIVVLQDEIDQLR